MSALFPLRSTAGQTGPNLQKSFGNVLENAGAFIQRVLVNLVFKAPGVPEDFVKAIKSRTDDVVVKTLESGESIEI